MHLLFIYLFVFVFVFFIFFIFFSHKGSYLVQSKAFAWGNKILISLLAYSHSFCKVFFHHVFVVHFIFHQWSPPCAVCFHLCFQYEKENVRWGNNEPGGRRKAWQPQKGDYGVVCMSLCPDVCCDLPLHLLPQPHWHSQPHTAEPLLIVPLQFPCFPLLGTAVFPLKSTRALPWSSPAHSYSHCWYFQLSNTPLLLVHCVPQSPSHEFSHLSTSNPTFPFGITLNFHFSSCNKITEKGGVNKLFLLFIMNLITNFLSNFPFGQEV